MCRLSDLNGEVSQKYANYHLEITAILYRVSPFSGAQMHLDKLR